MRFKSFKFVIAVGLLTLSSVSIPTYANENSVGVESLELMAEGYSANNTQEVLEQVLLKETESVIQSTIIVEQAKLREQPSPESDIINFLGKDLKVSVKERIDDFYLIEVGELKGYIYKSQIDENGLDMIPYTSTLPKEVAKVAAAPTSQTRGEAVVEYAKQFLGNPYVYGGNSLTNGVDCSGFTSQVYKQFGINLQRSSRAQYSGNGYKVSKADIKPGDLVFYGYNGYIDHVAIYAGASQIVHANSPKTGIKMSKLEYGKPIIGIKRVID